MKKMMSFLLALQTFCLVGGLSAAEGDGAPPRDQGFSQTLFMIAIALLFFYFILWRPEQKRRKALEQQRSSLKKGDRVSAMGIIGTVASIKDNTVVLRMVDGNKIEFVKAAVTEILESAPEGDSADKEGKSKPEDE